ncbi:MAG: 30S ribosomal protein S11 [Bacillales bacterium]|jgi:small subunit ribosomal protein S11|nr:30S ribosomal protein S11 [Bacillales bacterium]
MAKVVKKASTADRKKKAKKLITSGIVHIHASYNNTIVTVSDDYGNVLSWSSAGALGFKGSKKGTPYAASLAADKAVRAALDYGIKDVEVNVKGAGHGREQAIRALVDLVNIKAIADVTPIPHNGCRPPKKPRK